MSSGNVGMDVNFEGPEKTHSTGRIAPLPVCVHLEPQNVQSVQR